MEKNEAILKAYDYASRFVARMGYTADVNYLRDRLRNEVYKTVSTRTFFREYAWVVFASGFKARTVKNKWSKIGEMTRDFDPTKLKDRTLEELLRESPIKNEKKLASLLEASIIITDDWLQEIRTATSAESVKVKLIRLPFIGSVTVFHLMRNIGFDVFKPDRHIEKLSSELGASMTDMFGAIKENREEKLIGVIDYILWRSCETLGSATALINASQTDLPIPDVKSDGERERDFLY